MQDDEITDGPHLQRSTTHALPERPQLSFVALIDVVVLLNGSALIVKLLGPFHFLLSPLPFIPQYGDGHGGEYGRVNWWITIERFHVRRELSVGTVGFNLYEVWLSSLSSHFGA